MNDPIARWSAIAASLLLLSGLARAYQAEDPPLTVPAEVLPDEAPIVATPVAGPRHEALATPGDGAETVRVDRPPPAPIAESPRGDPPRSDARWVQGYWAWDRDRAEYTWVAGAWAAPRPGKLWVDGTWKRDAAGWYRAPGSWADRRPAPADWRLSGPPAEPPEEAITPAPGPGYFYVAGHYRPEGDRVVWAPGFWAEERAGWEWIPARWVRRADGWSYREGAWQRAASTSAAGPVPRPRQGGPFAPRDGPAARHVVARPVPVGAGSSGPAAIELEPIPRGERTDGVGPPDRDAAVGSDSGPGMPPGPPDPARRADPAAPYSGALPPMALPPRGGLVIAFPGGRLIVGLPPALPPALPAAPPFGPAVGPFPGMVHPYGMLPGGPPPGPIGTRRNGPLGAVRPRLRDILGGGR